MLFIEMKKKKVIYKNDKNIFFYNSLLIKTSFYTTDKASETFTRLKVTLCRSAFVLLFVKHLL